MTSTGSESSPRYFIEKNRHSEGSHSDHGVGPALRLCQELLSRAEPDPLRVEAALEILDAIAARDGDRARERNGIGFSKADSRQGHMLSKLSIDAARRDPAMLSEVLKMASRYQRQISRTGNSICSEHPSP
ncbi:hypothetical protein ELH02_14170 [Rhizobium ruizarguesonis]|uniref:hypothetical protein n=1 Tax=Rhizobium ruizarguesonis TaxID=2081791 RepID=UPI00102FBCBF|nr:hypothetical protein [Rhizobium ruizarguesonis]TBE45436.1 hypothetical protein ELH02_14170 [Rhizobium ruizarguesonis]